MHDSVQNFDTSHTLQVALKFEHRSSKGCSYGPPYEWSVYRYGHLVFMLMTCMLLLLMMCIAVHWEVFQECQRCTLKAARESTMSW